jgi:hypothetical protein
MNVGDLVVVDPRSTESEARLLDRSIFVGDRGRVVQMELAGGVPLVEFDSTFRDPVRRAWIEPEDLTVEVTAAQAARMRRR